MHRIHYPEPIEEGHLIALLLDVELPLFERNELAGIEKAAMGDHYREDAGREAIHRIITARGYEKKGKFQTAAIAYDRGARATLNEGNYFAAFLCASRAFDLYEKIGDTKNKKFAVQRRDRAVELLKGDGQPPAPIHFDWFTQHERRSSL